MATSVLTALFITIVQLECGAKAVRIRDRSKSMMVVRQTLPHQVQTVACLSVSVS